MESREDMGCICVCSPVCALFAMFGAIACASCVGGCYRHGFIVYPRIFPNLDATALSNPTQPPIIHAMDDRGIYENTKFVIVQNPLVAGEHEYMLGMAKKMQYNNSVVSTA